MKIMDSTATEACKSLYKRLCECSIAKDVSGLDDVLADDYLLVHMTGMVQSKSDYVEAVLDGTLNYYAIDHDSIDVAIDPTETEARICGKSRVHAAVFGGGKRWWRLRQDVKAINRNGAWQLIESRASTY